MFEKKDGSKDFVLQTCYGISERVIAAVIAVHGDDHGLVLPPKISPIQVVIIPIPYKGYEEAVLKKCVEVEKKLKNANIRVKLDLREKLTPGSKFFEWELRGIPVRVEVGPKDLQEKTLTLVRRDNLERIKVDETKIVEKTLEMLDLIHKSLREKALKFLLNHVRKVENLDEIIKLINEKLLVVETGWCGKKSCGLALEEKTNLSVLGTPVNEEKIENMRCSICGEKANFLVRLAKTY